MLTQEQLIAYYEHQLAPPEREGFERLLADEPEAQLSLADQENIHLALRVLLGKADAHERVKQSIFTVLRGASVAELTAHVMEETRAGRAAETTAKLEHSAAPWARARRFAVLTFQRFHASTLQQRLAYAASVAVIIAVALGGWIFFRPAHGARIVVGHFAALVGRPTVRHDGKASTLNPQPSTAIYFGDHIETGDADRAEIQFNDGTTLRLSFNTALGIPNPKSEIRNPKSPLSRPPEINLVRGQLWTKVAKLTNAPQYAVRTPVATAVAKGTEFGLKLQKIKGTSTNNVQLSTLNSQPSTIEAILTVKEGTVDFTNSLGSVQATAMTESTARADSAPTEPKRLQTLQVVRLNDSSTWSLITTPLDSPDAAERFSTGGGWTGLATRDIPGTNITANAATSEVRIARVLRKSSADPAALRPGDIVLALDGIVVTNAAQFNRSLLAHAAGTVTLAIRRGEESRSVSLTITNRASLLPGPALTSAQRARLAETTRTWLAASPLQPAAVEKLDWPVENQRIDAARRISRSPALRAAAENNLGVVFELEDALGPAIRAYGRAIYLDAKVPLYHFNLALALRKIGSFERAAEELEIDAQLAPKSIEARKRLAEIHSLLGQQADALAQTEAALQIDPSDHGLWELKTQLLTKQSRFAEALEAARKAVEIEPGCPAALDYLAEALHRQGKLAEAEQTYRKAIDLAPFDALPHMNLGVLELNRGQLWPAEQSLRKAIELRPDFALAYFNLGDLLASQRQYADATVAFEKAAGLDPADIKTRLALGRLALIQGRNDEAETRFRDALEASPHNVEALSGLAHVLSMKHNLPEAERLLRLANGIEPNSASVHNDLGEVLRMMGKLDDALQSYRKALELEPDNISPMNNIAIIQAMRGEHAEAEKMFRKLIDRAATDRRIYPLNFIVNLAMVCGKQGKLDEAEKYYRQALQMQPNDPGLASSLAYFLAEHQLKLDEALILAQRAVAAAPNEFNFLDNLGWALFQRGELEEAEKTLQKAVDLAGQAPSAAEIREHLRKVQEKKGVPPK